MNWETLLCIGDSITIGARSYMGYPEYAGFELENVLSKRWNVVNKSVSGYKTIDICRMIDDDFSNLKMHTPSIITILSGTNDIKSKVCIEDFNIAYSQLVTKARLLSPMVMLIKIPYFTKGIMYPYTFNMNDSIAEFNDIVVTLGNKNNLRVLDLDWQEEWFFDGVHLNDMGSKSVGKVLAEYILEDKGFAKDSQQ